MPKMLAQANKKLLWVPDGGIANIHLPTPAEVAAASAIDFSCLVTLANYQLGATGDQSVSDPALCADGESTVPGNTQYAAGMDFFRWTVSNEDKGWTTFTGKGIPGYFLERIGKRYDLPLVAGDEVKVMGVISGTPRDLAPDNNGGYQKFRVDFYPQAEKVDLRAKIATGS